jgi:predicted site-specific integrase-resolvase
MAAALVTVEHFAELIEVSRMSAYNLVRAGVIRVVDISLPGARRPRLRVPVSEADRLTKDRGIAAPKRGTR